MEGELCYASPTALLTKVSEMRPYPHRAVVPVSIDNRGAESVWLHRLRIPAPNLMLYSGKHGRLWTERVTLVRERGSTGDISEVRIAKGPPVELGDDVGVAADARIEPGESWRRCSARCSDERRSHAAPEPDRARELVERRQQHRRDPRAGTPARRLALRPHRRRGDARPDRADVAAQLRDARPPRRVLAGPAPRVRDRAPGGGIRSRACSSGRPASSRWPSGSRRRPPHRT